MVHGGASELQHKCHFSVNADAGRNFFSVNLAWNKLHEQYELKHISVHFSFLHYLVQVLVRSAIGLVLYSFSFFWNMLVLVLVNE